MKLENDSLVQKAVLGLHFHSAFLLTITLKFSLIYFLFGKVISLAILSGYEGRIISDDMTRLTQFYRPSFASEFRS